MALALLLFATDFRARAQRPLDRTVRRVVVEHINACSRQCCMKIADHLADRDFFVVCGDKHRDVSWSFVHMQTHVDSY